MILYLHTAATAAAKTEGKKMKATMRNRNNDKTVTVLVKKADSGIKYINKRQYLAALKKLGLGQIDVSIQLLVIWRGKQYGVIG